MSKREEIASQALGLDAGDRAALAHQLIESLDPLAEDPEVVEKAWAAEIERRIDQISRFRQALGGCVVAAVACR